MKSTKRKPQRKKLQKFDKMQKVILAVIGLCFVVVIFWLVFSLINRPERRVPGLISEMAEDYYENYLYEGVSNADDFKNNPDEMMAKFVKNGFSPVKLRTLLLFDNQKNAKYADEILKYCKGDATSVKFYPEAPYGQKDYRIEYSYSCEF